VRRVVAGRLINVYSSKDWVLQFLCRATQASYTVAGLQAIGVPGVESFDATKLIADGGHSEYRSKLREIAALVQFSF
jgi:hypothetical protein